jgi:predicted nucleotidyltransferase component of viral defense system
MENLARLENFEIEVIEYLNKGKFLSNLVFVGGTMLRLCYGLNRFSVDLDFWLIKKVNSQKFFSDLEDFLEKRYIVKDSASKFSTILFEIGSQAYPRNLKIEVRKEIEKIKYEKTIAYSRFSSFQVLVNALSLEEMMKYKVASFLDREEIRDCFDIEFLLKRGVPLPMNKEEAEKFLRKIGKLKDKDYKIKLASIIEKKEREYYLKKNFEILKMELKRIIFAKV